MENLYKEALRCQRAANSELSQQFNIGWSYKEFVAVPVVRADHPPAVVEEKVTSEVTEKTRVLDELYQFGEKALEGLDSVKVDGGELVKKVAPEVSSALISPLEFVYETAEQIEAVYSKLNLNPSKIQYKMAKVSGSDSVKVFFVTDSNFLREDFDSDNESDLSTYFAPEVCDLFNRMIAAMKLGQNDYAISSTTLNDTEINDTLFSEINALRPALIMTLGAKSTHTFLRGSERLKDIHGRFYDIRLVPAASEEYNTKLMPIFSPKLLQTAPNMKKTAWSDMQEAMKFLNL